MSTFSQKLKSLIFILIISSLISFIICAGYPFKNEIFLSLKSLFVEIPNIGYYNYEKIGNKFIVTNEEHFLYVKSINAFVKDINVKLNKTLDKSVPLKIFVNDSDLGKTLLVYENKEQYLNNYIIQVNRNIKDVVVVIGDKQGDTFYFDSISCNNDTFYFSGINLRDYFLQVKRTNFWIRFLMVFVVLLFVFLHFFFNINELYKWLYKSRYYLGLGIILFAVVFELNNSSIGLWNLLSTDFSQKQSDIIFGEARDIRSDEYAVYTPMLFSQDPDYGYYNNCLRGTKTDVFMVYGQPVKNIVSVFRPFLLGFLFLGTAKGLSLFWILRLVLLFLVSFEFLMLLSNRNKIVSLMGTLLITFAPAVQWWWTTNGIVEMIIYGELLILLLNNYFIQKGYVKRILNLFIITLLIGSYILVLYPAWQVPMGYIFSFVFIGVWLENYKNYKFYKKDIIHIIFFMVLLILAGIYIYVKSKETINLITNTIYPGLRFETGGERSVAALFRYWGNIFFPFTANNLKSNVCEFSVFFDFFPVGLIISFLVLFKDKIKDKILIILLLLDLFFIFWCIVGVPKIVAQITLMKVSPDYRTIVALSFLNILIFVRSISLLKCNLNKIYSFCISFILTCIIVISNVFIYEKYFDILKAVTVSLLSFVLFYLILRKRISKIFIILVILIMIVAGLFVNPIQKGINVVTDLELSKAIKKIDAQENGLWIVEGKNFIFNNFPVFQHIKLLNSTNTYPNFEFLRQLDENGKYIDVYNRYANIIMNLVHENRIKDKFVLLTQDTFCINITADDISKLNINYVVAYRPLDEFNNDKINFEKIYYVETRIFEIYIYKVNKLDNTGEQK